MTKLKEIGDWLYSIDTVKEKNCCGFNKIDWHLWLHVNGSVTRMAIILKKYKRQILASTFGDAGYKVVLDNLPKSNLTVTSEGEILVNGFLERELFGKYIMLVKGVGCRFNSTTKSWSITTGFDLSGFVNKANALGFEVEVFIKDVVDVIETREKAAKSVHVTLRDGYVAFVCKSFSDDFNDIFSNRSGVLSGITEYDPLTHARLTNSVRLAQEAIEKIKEIMVGWAVVESPEFISAVALEDARDEADKTAIPQVAKLLAPGYALFTHQNRGVKFLDKTGGLALIGACMGSGKTLITLAWAAANGKRIAVVSPKVVRRMWCQEAAKFFPSVFAGKCLELKGGVRTRDLKKYQLVSVNYESLPKYSAAIVSGEFDVLVLDESHLIKNGKSKRSKACADLAASMPHKILLSGTAIKNSRIDLLAQLALVSPDLFHGIDDLINTTIGGFWHKISDCYLPMAKSDVLRFLPPKLVNIKKVEVATPVDFPRNVEDVANAKVACALSKISSTIDEIENILENSDSKILVFSDSLQAVDAIYQHFGSTVAILHHGQLSDKAREDAKDNFQNGTHRIFVTTRQSLAVGATLTAADTVIFNDLPWTTADIQQAEDRTHRIGQLKSVNVYWMTAANSTFDAHVCDLLYRKYLICKAVNEGKQITKEEREFMEKAISFSDIATTSYAT